MPKKTPAKGPKKPGRFMVGLPNDLKPGLAFLKAKYRRPTTVELVIALEKHLKDEGYKPNTST